MRVTKALSNNAVLAVDAEGREVVALGRGIGHARRSGDIVEESQIERVFTAGRGVEREQLSTFLSDVPLECVRGAAMVADLARERFQVPVTQALILALADHISFAVRRRSEGIQVVIPLAWEVSQLYPHEVDVGRLSLTMLRDRFRLDLADDEAFALAMHFVNGQLATPGTTVAAQMTETIARVFDVVRSATGVPIDSKAMSTARFVTHLRYLFARIATTQRVQDPSPVLSQAIGNAHPEAMACAEKVAHLIGMDTGGALGRNEVAYLALHIARLVWAARESEGTSDA